MQSLNTTVSACKYCQYYKPTGRRGGNCEMLGVSVQGGWKGCHLGTTPFSAGYETYESYEKNCDLGHNNGKNVQKLPELTANTCTI